MRKRWWVAGIGVLVVGALGVGVWWLSRPPSLGWTAEEIAAEQRALVEASMPEGEAAWPLIEEAVERRDAIAAAWAAPMTGEATMVLESLRMLPWGDPMLAKAKSAAAELAPVVDLLLEASRRPRLYDDGAAAQEAGAWLDGESAIPAGTARWALDVLLVDARRALANGDAIGFADRLRAHAALTRTVAQSPLLITTLITLGMHAETLAEITHAVRTETLPPEACAALRATALEIASFAADSDVPLWEGERLYVYAEALRQLKAIDDMGVFDRLELRGRAMINGVDSLDPFDEQITWGWMAWIGSHSNAELRRRIDAQFEATAAWWDEPFETRPAHPPDLLGFPEVGLFEDADVAAMTRGFLHLLEARAVGVAALLEIEAHHSRTGAWPASLDEVAGAADLRCPVTGEAFVYTPALPTDSSVWPFTLRLPIDDETYARLDLPLGGAFTGSNAIERPDRLLITQEPEDIDTGDLTMYPWLGRVEEE